VLAVLCKQHSNQEKAEQLEYAEMGLLEMMTLTAVRTYQTLIGVNPERNASGIVKQRLAQFRGDRLGQLTAILEEGQGAATGRMPEDMEEALLEAFGVPAEARGVIRALEDPIPAAYDLSVLQGFKLFGGLTKGLAVTRATKLYMELTPGYEAHISTAQTMEDLRYVLGASILRNSLPDTSVPIPERAPSHHALFLHTVLDFMDETFRQAERIYTAGDSLRPA
jgi:hypothetical protein